MLGCKFTNGSKIGECTHMGRLRDIYIYIYICYWISDISMNDGKTLRTRDFKSLSQFEIATKYEQESWQGIDFEQFFQSKAA